MLNARDAATFLRVGVVGVVVVDAVAAVAVDGVTVDFAVIFCSDCFNGEFRINSSKSSSISSTLCDFGTVVAVDDPDTFCKLSISVAMRKFNSKSNGLIGC